MKFHEFPTVYDLMKREGVLDSPKQTPKEFYIGAITRARSGPKVDAAANNQFASEMHWYQELRPYYLVYPSVIPMLTRLTLDLDSGLIKPPMPTLCLRLPVEKNPLTWADDGGQSHSVQSILVSTSLVAGGDGLTLWTHCGEQVANVPIHFYRNFRLEKGRTVEDDIRDLPVDPITRIGLQWPEEIDLACIRLAVTLCLIAAGDEGELLSPDVLNRDAKKEVTPNILARAKRNGKFGWHVGRDLEVVPHVRRPHLGIRWTGKGRTVPKLRPIKGSIVHRDKIEKIPGGRMDLEEPPHTN